MKRPSEPADASALHEERAVHETLRRIGAALAAEIELDRLVQLLTDEATQLCGAQFGAFFYNVDDAKGESYMLYTISGVPREAFSKFPMPRNTAVFAPTFAGAGVVRSDDITTDPRYGKSAPYHGMPAGHLPVRSYLAVPVVSRAGGVIGGLFFGHAEPAVFSQSDEHKIVAVAAQASIAFDNARLYAESRRARLAAEAMQGRFRFLADASDVLAESLDYESTLRRVAKLAVPRLADWCTFLVVDEAGQLQRVAAVHRDPALDARMAEYERNDPSPRAGGLLAVFERGETVLMPSVGDAELVAAAQSDAHLELLRALGCTSCLMVPVLAHGHPLGVLSFNLSGHARSFSADDVRVAEELAHRAALAIDNAASSTVRRSSGKPRRRSSPKRALSSARRSTTPRRCRRSPTWSCRASPTGAPCRLSKRASCVASPSRTSTRRRSPTPTSCNGAAAGSQRATGTPAVIRSGKSELFADISVDLMAAIVSEPDQLRVLRELGLRSALTVPLVARGRALGGLTLIWAESNRRYGEEERRAAHGGARPPRRAPPSRQRAPLSRRAGGGEAARRLLVESPRTSCARRSRRIRLSVQSLKRKRQSLAAECPRASPSSSSDRPPGRAASTLLIDELLDVSRITWGAAQISSSPEFDARGAGARGRRRASSRSPTGRLHGDAVHLGGAVVAAGIGCASIRSSATSLSNAMKYGGERKPIAIARGATATTGVEDLRARSRRRHLARGSGAHLRALRARRLRRHFGGFGLGLWIVRQIVEAHGGALRVEERAGRGLDLHRQLPLVVTG